ncbi:MAG: hypothetical protein H6667_05790 [Ardenticatenaceae bacterium]|nr:hypothetical protein [Ardenticatenaceae bacterium]MCB9444589.1 hypothetical protein [Ardenticatenaceae bacterium]
MTNTCQNCGQPTLETDTICWHCGQPLPQQPKSQPKQPKATAVTPDSVPPLPLQSIAAYGGLILLIIIALLWVMHALGQQPQVVQSLGSSVKPGWTAVTDTNRIFTLNLPVQWQTLDRYASDQEDAFVAALRQNSYYQAALAPYDAMADDRQVLLLAQADPAEMETAVPAFVLVTRSQQISQLTPEKMTALLEAGPAGFDLQRVNVEMSVNGREQATYIAALPFEDQTLRCQQLFYKSEVSDDDSYLIIGCVSQDGHATYTNIFHDILVSFQPLLR